MTEFQQLVRKFIQVSEENHRKIAHEFSVSLPTVGRWGDGETVPHPILRPKVEAFLKKELKKTD